MDKALVGTTGLSGAPEERAAGRAADGPDSDFETAASSDGSDVEAARSPESAAAARSPKEAEVETMTDLGKKGGASTLNCFERELVEDCESVVVVVEVAEEVVVMEVELEDETGGCGT